MQEFGVSGQAVRTEVERFISGFPAQEVTAKIPYTPRVGRALLLATREAKSMNCTGAGPEHILLGLLRVRDGVAARVLKEFGLNTERIRKAILQYPPLD